MNTLLHRQFYQKGEKIYIPPPPPPEINLEEGETTDQLRETDASHEQEATETSEEAAKKMEKKRKRFNYTNYRC